MKPKQYYTKQNYNYRTFYNVIPCNLPCFDLVFLGFLWGCFSKNGVEGLCYAGFGQIDQGLLRDYQIALIRDTTFYPDHCNRTCPADILEEFDLDLCYNCV